ncbi:RDD family protein [Oceanobacter mangrovi]|uniref:RDD family protein n=1 Tax=Oceanobacter mangrovi TaxID=2862510 RepID=UPI001C8DE593|nr:RDD family protein [Oceanobacter mangrovi]
MSDHNYPTAPLLRRLAALAYDALVLLGVFLILGLVIVGIAAALNHGEPLGALPGSIVYSLIFCMCFFYYSTSWRRGGQTIGMKAWRIKLVADDGKPIRLSHCMLRTGAGFFSLMAFGLGFFWALIDKRQRSWHDMASLTHIVQIPKA